MKKGITIKDIARKLNMSVSTVSKALNNNPLISRFTKERVQKFAEEWDYIPNETARHFKQNKSFTIGLIIPDLLDQFYVLAINGVEKIARKSNYNVMISQTHEDSQTEKQIVESMIKNRVDGVIVAVSKNTSSIDLFKRLINIGIPVVFFSRSFSAPEFDYVSADNEGGSLKAMLFLFEKGHTRIAHLKGPDFLRTSHQRLEGYKHALQQANISFDPHLVVEIDLTQAETFSALQRLMELPDPPTAFFTFKNYVSLDVIKFLKTNFPEKLNSIDIVGFGNLPLIQYLDHKPSASIEENSYLMGVEAARLIFKNIDLHESGQPLEPQFMKVPCTVVTH